MVLKGNTGTPRMCTPDNRSGVISSADHAMDPSMNACCIYRFLLCRFDLICIILLFRIHDLGTDALNLLIRSTGGSFANPAHPANGLLIHGGSALRMLIGNTHCVCGVGSKQVSANLF